MELLLAFLIIAALYGLAAVLDIVRINSYLIGGWRQLSPGTAPQKRPPKPLTSAAAELLERVDQLDAAAARRVWLMRARLLESTELPTPQHDAIGESYWSELARFISENFSCSAAGIVCMDGKSAVEVIALEQEDWRLRHSIEVLARGALADIAERPARAGSARVVTALSAFGYPCSLLIPLAAPLPQNAAGGWVFLWAGYQRSWHGLDEEQRILELLVAGLRRKLEERFRCQVLRDQIESEQRRNRDQELLVAQAAHDIGSPIGTVQTVLSLARCAPHDSELPRYIDGALSGCEAVREVIESLIELARHRRAGGMPAAEVTDLNTAAQTAAEIFRVPAGAKGLQLELIQAPAAVPVRFNSRALARVLMNLISNAVKYTAAGKVQIAVSADGSVTVSDTGPGLSDQLRSEIFKPFTRGADDSGHGLGLAIAALLAEENGAAIEHSSEPGKGARFAVRCRALQPTSADIRLQSETPKVPRSKREVLIADDDPVHCAALAKVVGLAGWRALSATTVDQGIALVNFAEPTCLIVDGRLGSESAARLVQFALSRGSRPRIALLSGDSAAPDTIPHDIWLRKPLEPQLLIDWLEQKGPQIQAAA